MNPDPPTTGPPPGDLGVSGPPSGDVGVSGPPPGRRPRPSATGDAVLRVLGGVLALLGGFLTAGLAVLLVPLRLADLGLPGAMVADAWGVGAVRVPVAVLVAIGGGLFLSWFTRQATGRRWWAVLPPAVGWFAMLVVALRVTTEGDRLLVPDDWVAVFTLFGGTVVLVIGLVRTLTSPSRPTGGARPANHRSSQKSAGARPPG